MAWSACPFQRTGRKAAAPNYVEGNPSSQIFPDWVSRPRPVRFRKPRPHVAAVVHRTVNAWFVFSSNVSADLQVRMSRTASFGQKHSPLWVPLGIDPGSVAVCYLIPH